MVESVPELTGIPLVIGWQPHDWVAKLEGHWSTFVVKLHYAQFKPIKALRVIMVFMVSKFDYVASGFPLACEWLQGLQQKLNALFCRLYGLSDRTAHLLLYLPMHAGGLGCPWLTVRADVRYLKAVMVLEYG